MRCFKTWNHIFISIKWWRSKAVVAGLSEGQDQSWFYKGCCCGKPAGTEKRSLNLNRLRERLGTFTRSAQTWLPFSSRRQMPINHFLFRVVWLFFLLFCDFGQSDPSSDDKNLTSECNVESFKETIRYIQTRKLKAKLRNRLGPTLKMPSRMNWQISYVTWQHFFCVFYSTLGILSNEKSFCNLGKTLHQQLCLSIQSPPNSVK